MDFQSLLWVCDTLQDRKSLILSTSCWKVQEKHTGLFWVLMFRYFFLWFQTVCLCACWLLISLYKNICLAECKLNLLNLLYFLHFLYLFRIVFFCYRRRDVLVYHSLLIAFWGRHYYKLYESERLFNAVRVLEFSSNPSPTLPKSLNCQMQTRLPRLVTWCTVC